MIIIQLCTKYTTFKNNVILLTIFILQTNNYNIRSKYEKSVILIFY